ncbi:MAG: plasmid stabilization protein [Rhodomicrobium sp.]
MNSEASPAGDTGIARAGVDDALKLRLERRANRHGKRIEAEGRDILREVLSEPELQASNLYAAIRSIVEPIGGLELEIPPREPVREPPRFE